MAVELSPPLATKDILSSYDVSSTLLHELQLGGQLNESVVQARRADFSLMLSMLAEDVREQSQFLLPTTPAVQQVEVTNTLLRKAFNLPDKAALALKTIKDVKQFNQAQSVMNNDLATLRLTDAIAPKPLAFRDDSQHINTQILQNTSLFTQLKHQQLNQKKQQEQLESVDVASVDKALNLPLTFNSKAWLDNVNHCLVEAPLLS